MNSAKTLRLFKKARQVMPGGVNSSVRVNQALALQRDLGYQSWGTQEFSEPSLISN
jgi:hypothetical protein